LATVGADTRARILAAALDLFERDGFRGTTIKNITDRCDITPPALYVYFPSKDELLSAVVRESYESLITQLTEAEASAGDDDPAAVFEALVRALVLFSTRHRKSARIADRDWRFLRPPFREKVADMRRDVRARLEQAIVRGVDAGALDLPTDLARGPATVATALLDMSTGVAAWYRDDQGGMSADELADLYCRMAARIVTGASTPAAKALG